MSLMKIEVVPDASTPSGGHAIIRLRGIALVPPGATFRIDPIDEDADGLHGDWPRGDLVPLETRQTEDGVELRIGPEVVDATWLEPGTPVTFSVPEADISAELVWPTLPVSQGKQAPAVVMTPTQFAQELAAAERARALAAAEPEALPSMPSASQSPGMAAADGPVPEAAQIAAVPEGQSGSPEPKPEPASPIGAMSLPGALAPPQLPAASELPPLFTGGTAERPRPADKSLSRLTKAVERSEPPAEAEGALPSIVLKQASHSAGAVDVSRGQLHPGTIDGTVTKPRPSGRVRPFLLGATASGLVAAAVIAALLYSGVRGPGGLLPGPDGAIGAASGGTKIGIADVFSAGYQSPRGEIATNVDLSTALKLADYNLHGIDRPVDRAEAEFWLKKAMSLTASHSQIRWAVTQLGTLQADPINGPPDYEKARILWEIAATNGDPIAMCFLGTLLEFGLGQPADKAKALQQFKRAKDFGGCPNADEAIARLSK